MRCSPSERASLTIRRRSRLYRLKAVPTKMHRLKSVAGWGRDESRPCRLKPAPRNLKSPTQDVQTPGPSYFLARKSRARAFHLSESLGLRVYERTGSRQPERDFGRR